MEIAHLGIRTANNSNESRTVGQLRGFATDICHCAPDAVILQVEGEELSTDRFRLKSLQMSSTSVIIVQLDGMECTSCTIYSSRVALTSPITSICEHERTTCTKCLEIWIGEQFDTASWDQIFCPEYDQSLMQEDVRKHATEAVCTRSETLATRAALSAILDFRWCLNPVGRDDGHIHDAESGTIFTCNTFKYRSCTFCDRKLHEGETCEQYTMRMKSKESSARHRKRPIR